MKITYPERLKSKFPEEYLYRILTKLGYKRWGGAADVLLNFCEEHGVEVDDVHLEHHSNGEILMFKR